MSGKLYETNVRISTDTAKTEPNPIEELKTLIGGLTAFHSFMRRANAYYRKNKTCKGFPGMSDAEADCLDANVKEKNLSGPYTPNELSRSNAKLKRLKIKLSTLQDAQEE